MRILFLGGTGNISTACAARLHQQGHEIWILSRGLKPVPAAYQTITGERRNLPQLAAQIERAAPEVVLDWIGYEPADLELTHAVFRGRIRQYVFVSSATVYQKPAPCLPITEATPLGNPYWDYAQKKVLCEEWLRQRGRDEGFPFTIVRPSHTYSHLWIPNPVSSASYSFAARLERGEPVFVPDDGTSLWTLTAATDFAVGFAALVGREEAIGEAFHITSDETLTWRQIVREIGLAVGVEPEIVPVPTDFICQTVPELAGTLQGDKAHSAVFDNTKLRRVLPNFRCVKPFSVGVRESIAWLREHPADQNLNPKVDARIETVLNRWQLKPK
jgi:nucleoside-diphosphate-sugar epimerase